MHSRIARCCAVVSATVLLWNCDARQPLQPVADEDLVASAANQKGPSGLTANALPGAISLGWQDNSPNEIGFQVLRSTTGASGTFTTITTTAAKVTSYTDTGLDPNQQYCYKVQAIGQQNRVIGVSNTVCANPLPLQPLAASKVAAAFMSTATVQITWTDNSMNEDGFRVERAASDAGPWTALVTTTAGLTSAQDGSGIPNQERVCYRVIAFNHYGDGPASNTSCTAFPAAPTNLVAKALDGQTIDLTWTDNSAFEDGYEVQRCCQTGWIVIANLAANATSYRDAGLLINTQYYYVVRAKKDQGFSAYSNYASAITATSPPSAPTALAWPASSSSITVYWIDNSGIAESFRVERSLDGGTSWMPFGPTVPGQTYLSDDGRTPEQQVCYRVYAANSLGESGPSNVACTAPPAGPTDLVATGVDALTIDLAWTDNSAVEDGYEVWIDDGYGNQYAIASLAPNTTSFRYQGDPYAYYYAYFVAAIKDGGYSDWSNTAFPTPPPVSTSVATTSTTSPRSPQRAVVPRRPTRRLPAPAHVRRAAPVPRR